MRKNPFAIFSMIVATLIAAAILFIQSQQFAHLFKRVVAQYLPKDLGVEADFSEFRIQMFPPGLSLKNPKIVLRDRNVLKMPGGSSVTAGRIEFIFRPFQMFSGNIRVHELSIVDGELRLFQDPSAEPKNAPKKNKDSFRSKVASSFHWDELFQIHAEAISLVNTKVRVEMIGTHDFAEMRVDSVRLGQWMGKGGLGYELSADIKEAKTSLVPSLPTIDHLKLDAKVNALGARIDSFLVQLPGADVRLEGAMKGDIRNPKAGLSFDGDAEATGDLASVLRGFEAGFAGAGQVRFVGRLKGDLSRPLETIRAQGTFGAKDFSIRNFRADELEAIATWTATPSGGELAVEKMVVQAKDRERGPGKAAVGGKLTVGAFKAKIGSQEPIALRVDFERARLQWLAALGLSEMKYIYPVDLKFNGPAEVAITPPAGNKALELKAKLKLRVDDFQLDNQKINQPRKLQKIFQVPKILAEGGISIRSGALQFENFSLGVQKTKLQVVGKIDFKSGFDFKATGPADLAEIGSIAETPIRGTGTANIGVHGPIEKAMIDVDVDAKDAFYLNLAFGDFTGRISWDDDIGRLIFSNIHAKKGTTPYTLEGTVDLGKVEKIALRTQIARGNMQDFLQIFQNLTRDFWWFPQSLEGGFSGDIEIGGGVSLSELQIQGRLNGNGWEYLGERFDKVAMSGGYDRGKYLISDFRANKRGSRMQARLSFDQENRIDWDFRTQNLTFADLDHLARLDVPMRGRISFESSGKGKEGSVVSSTELSITDVAVRGSPMLPSLLSIRASGGVTRVKGSALGNQGSLDAVYDFNPLNTSTIRAEFKRIDYSPILLLLNPKAIQDPAVIGLLSGSANLSFHSGQIEQASGDVSVTEYLLGKTGTRFQLVRPISFRVNEGSFDIRDLSVQGNRGEAHLNLRSRKAALDGTLSGDLDVSLAEFFTSAISRASGLATLDYIIGGTIKAPTVFGRATLQGGSFWAQGLESPFENVVGVAEINQNVIQIRDVESDLAGGRASAGGTISLFADRFPVIALKADFSGNRIKVFPFQYAKIRGGLRVSGDRIPYLIDGSLIVDSALSKEKVFQQRQGAGLKAAQYTPPPTAQRLSDYPKFKLNIDVVSDGGIMIQNDLFVEAEAKGKLTVVNTLEAPRIVGNAELIHGRMSFKDRVFQIQSASAVFDNPAVINPKFNMTARTDVNGTKVQLYAAGAMDALKIELSSIPVMSETEILSLLALGMTSNDAKKLSATDRTTFESGEAASLLLHSLDFNREVQSKTGIQIQLDESVNSQIGTSVFRPTGTNENGAAPKIVIRKQIAKNLDVSYGSTVGVGTNSQREVNAEVKLSPGMSVIGVWDNYETLDTQDKRTSYGLDFKLQKRFK